MLREAEPERVREEEFIVHIQEPKHFSFGRSYTERGREGQKEGDKKEGKLF